MAFLGAKTYTVRRFAAGSYVNGDWIEGVETAIDIVGSLQPAKGEELELLPEGARKRAVKKLYSDTELRTVNLAGQTTPDILITSSGEYHVHDVGDWTDHDVSTRHWKYMVLRRGTDADA